MANSLFYYIGDDEAYYKSLVGEFKRSTRLQIEFKSLYETEEKKIQSLFIKIFKEKPACVFIDFSKHTQDYLHLARILARTPLEHKLTMVGLVDYLSPVEVLKETLATGVQLTHLKGPECFDVVFDTIKLVDPGQMGDHSFAKAKLKESWDAGLQVKVGFVGSEGLHFETDYVLKKGDEILLNHEWLKKKIVPSKTVTIQKVETSNIFYQFKFAVDATFKFVDDDVPDREEKLLFHRKQLAKWIQENSSDSLPKRSKILIVDRDFRFYDHQERTDKHPYTLRCVPYLNDIRYEIDRLEPQIIVYTLEKEEAEAPKNTLENFTKLLEYIKNKIQDTSPFVIVFNAKHSSKEMQDSYGYAQLMASEHEISIDLLERIADKLDKKFIQDAVVPLKEDRKVFLKKTSSLSIAEIIIPITVKKVSETDMIFETNVTLQEGMNLHLEAPVEMFINVTPLKSQSKVPEYHGLIHCLGEKEKADLRRYVNSVFFRDHDAQVTAETEEFKKLNELKLQEKEEALKANLEALEAKKEPAE